jgi:glutamate-5-semialdehyde dehydrogenase
MSERQIETVDIPTMMDALGRQAREAGRALANAASDDKNAALARAAELLEERAGTVLAANAVDIETARSRGLGDAMLDRLMLDESRIAGIAKSLRDVVELPDPVGQVIAEWERPNGLESFYSSNAIHACMTEALRQTALPEEAVQMVPTTDREAVGYLLGNMTKFVDVVVPRGGRSLIERVQRDARVPVIGHLEGICHVYVHEAAELEMARAVLLNSKMRRTGICGAAETLLVDSGCVETHLRPLVEALIEAGCEVRGDERTQACDARVRAATEEDWRTEYLDAVISVRVVAGVGDAIAHIARYGSGHTESIVTGDENAAERFLREVDSAIVLHNASTQFADGGEFGMGAEIGISTGRIHARGPVGAEQLTSFKYRVHGSGQTRPA